LKHCATSDFWSTYRALPADVRDLAAKSFELLKSDPQHPSLQFKTVKCEKEQSAPDCKAPVPLPKYNESGYCTFEERATQ
jgi:hypothetical protein